MPTAPLCATHTAFVYERGGITLVGEITGLFEVNWNRVRDDISEANVKFSVIDCCALASQLSTVRHELHIFRDGVSVWEGPITRLEFEFDTVEIYASDILWVAKKRVMEHGYNYHYGTGNPGAQPALPHISWLLNDECFGRYLDEWEMIPSHLFPVNGPDDPVISRSVNAYSQSIWEDLDYAAQYNGIDYTVVGRDVYWFDTHLDWNPIDTLLESWLSKYPRIVEYGNDYANRYIRTDGSGYAGVGITTAQTQVATFSPYIDLIANEVDQTEPEEVNGVTQVPTTGELDAWAASATKRANEYAPPRTAIVVPANTTLLPTCTWDIDTLMPGSWFLVDVQRQCRQVTEYHKLNEIRVKETGDEGETVSMTSSSAPTTRLVPAP